MESIFRNNYTCIRIYIYITRETKDGRDSTTEERDSKIWLLTPDIRNAHKDTCMCKGRVRSSLIARIQFPPSIIPTIITPTTRSVFVDLIRNIKIINPFLSIQNSGKQQNQKIRNSKRVPFQGYLLQEKERKFDEDRLKDVRHGTIKSIVDKTKRYSGDKIFEQSWPSFPSILRPS